MCYSIDVFRLGGDCSDGVGMQQDCVAWVGLGI